MIELFSALAIIPEAICGMAHSPRATLAALAIVFLVIIPGYAIYDAHKQPEPVPVVVVVEQPKQVEEAPKERRIVRFAKWLWKKE